jgi:hypothetical protein
MIICKWSNQRSRLTVLTHVVLQEQPVWGHPLRLSSRRRMTNAHLLFIHANSALQEGDQVSDQLEEFGGIRAIDPTVFDWDHCSRIPIAWVTRGLTLSLGTALPIYQVS